MTTVHRATVSVPYRAEVVPKGARNARWEPFKVDVPVEFEVLEEAPPVAVRCIDGNRREISYLGHGGALWLPVLSDDGWTSPPMPAEQVLRHFARGDVLRGQVAATNPFAIIGAHRMKDLNLNGFTGRIEDASLREVRSHEADEARAAAQRVAREFALTGDGRMLRRSPGPVWTQFSVYDLHAVPLAHVRDTRGLSSFACNRRTEARASFEQRMGHAPARMVGDIEVLLPEHVDDIDAEVAARQVVKTIYADWIRHVEPLASPAVAALARQARTGFERLHGMDFDLLKGDGNRNRTFERPVEALRPTPAEILSAVESFRLFVAEMPGDISDHEVEKICAGWRSSFESISKHEIDRFDTFEVERLEAEVHGDVPEIGPEPSPGSAP